MTQTLLRDPPHAAPPRKRVLTAMGLLLLVASAIVGSDAYGIRERLWGTEAPAQSARRRPRGRRAIDPARPDGGSGEDNVRSQPWWQKVTTVEGTGAMTAPAFTIDAGAIQWRVRWTCQTGRLTVQVPNRPRPVVDASCPGGEAGYGTQTGSVSLQVRADGPWQLQVDQQLDVPLNEPPLPAMTAPGARTLATGEFYRIDQTGTGQVHIYRLPDGSHALRLENFYVTPNVDLEVVLSPLAEPRSTQQISDAGFASVARLDVTAGSMNFTVPPNVNPSEFKSVVIWCQPAFSAYSAAVLQRGQ